MGIGEDEIRHENPNSAAESGAASQSAEPGTDVAVSSGPATEEASADLPTSEGPEHKRGDAGAKPEGVATSDRPKSTAARAMPILAGERVGGPSNESGVHPQPRSWRFASLAATIALAAGAGSFLGALAAGAFAHHPASAAVPGTAGGRDASESLKTHLAELTALRESLDRVNRSANAQFAKIGQRLDSLEHAQAGPAAKLAHVADAIDRLEKQRTAAPDVTGSISSNPPSKTSAQSLPPPVLHSWIIEEVHNGRAMVESRYGDVFVVGAGSMLPGLGRVEQIERQDGRWVVVTASGLITSPR
jgi:hypothetical protein